MSYGQVKVEPYGGSPASSDATSPYGYNGSGHVTSPPASAYAMDNSESVSELQLDLSDVHTHVIV